MSDFIMYRWPSDPETDDEPLLIELVENAILVPDTRLQAIANATRCEHDRIDEHHVGVAWKGAPWCLGAPELAALLDALTEENKCARCDGAGQVYDEVFENEWAKCPYWDHDAGLQCVEGLVVAIEESNDGESSG